MLEGENPQIKGRDPIRESILRVLWNEMSRLCGNVYQKQHAGPGWQWWIQCIRLSRFLSQQRNA